MLLSPENQLIVLLTLTFSGLMILTENDRFLKGLAIKYYYICTQAPFFMIFIETRCMKLIIFDKEKICVYVL